MADKFVPFAKLSKKAQKAWNRQKRGDWGSLNPQTRVADTDKKKRYSRKGKKKIDFFE